jgi:DinB superfamily
MADKQALREEIESIRTAYHALLGSLSDDDWGRKSANPAWSVGQLMWHLGRGMEFFPETVEHCRKGRGPNPPSFLIGPGNVLLTRFGSRGADRTSVAEKYDRAHEKLMACLDGVQDDEWDKSARIYGNDYTIASTFGEVTTHFREHEADILRGLGRS